MGLVQKLNYLLDTKEAIKEAIINKKVEVSDTDTFRSYAEKIGTIKAGGDDILINAPTAFALPVASATLIISNETDIRIVNATAEIKEN